MIFSFFEKFFWRNGQEMNRALLPGQGAPQTSKNLLPFSQVIASISSGETPRNRAMA